MNWRYSEVIRRDSQKPIKRISYYISERIESGVKHICHSDILVNYTLLEVYSENKLLHK